MYIDYPLLKENARKNRLEMTDAEIAIWAQLKNKQLGVRFRRQHVIGDYIVDFVCLERHLVIEIDGGYHESEEQQKEDEIRTQYISQMGFRVVRFTNGEVLGDIESVINIIRTNLLILNQ